MPCHPPPVLASLNSQVSIPLASSKDFVHVKDRPKVLQNMSKIPLDIITDILCRQPVKTLLRFRCISKTCCSLIDSQDFIKMHLNYSLQAKSDLSLILKGLQLYTLDFDALNTPLELQHPLNIGGGTEVIGSCNGLIVLRNSEQDLALFNPSTRKLKRLPVTAVESPSDSCSPGYVFYGFGHDNINDDYKILRLAQFKEKDRNHIGFDGTFDYEVKLYSLKNDSWRKISNLPRNLGYLFQFFYHLMFRRGYGVLASGVLHWVAPVRPELHMRNSIVAFDLEAEQFRELPLPDYGDGNENADKKFLLDVGVLEGCLCVVCYHDQVCVDVWMMKEYGVKESWIKLFTIQRPRTMSYLAFLRPLAYSRGSDKVLVEVNGEKLLWYDLEKRSLRSVRIHGGPDSFGTEICVGSLVPLNDGDDGIQGMKPRQEQKETKKRYNKKRDDFLSKGFKLVL